MGRRIDYLNDPDAPAANSLRPSVNTIVVNEHGQILLIRRTDNGNWSLPGGAIDPGETIRQAAVRETREETGVRCSITGVCGLYSNPNHVIQYTSDGEVRQEFSIVLTADYASGEPTPSDESSHVEWVAPGHLDAHAMHESMRNRIDYFLGKPTAPYLD
jgi:8-oxo-dGTP pyrophosphatase MutT (NUDIX family)